MRFRFLSNLFRAVCVWLWLAAGPSSAAPPPWPDASFTFIADKQALTSVLSTFGRSFGLEVSISAAVAERSETVDGKFTSPSPTEFLDQLCSTFGLQWFYHGGTLYFSRSFEIATRSISPNGIALGDFRKALTDLGVVEPKFGWGELPERGIAMISGPPAYVDLVVWAVATLPLPQPQQQVKVFRLKYAQVNDRVISYRDQQITTAGVASILRNLVTGQGGTGTTLATTPQLAAIATTLRSSAPVAEVNDPQGQPSRAAGDSGRSGATSDRPQPFARAVIQADSRLNALVIKDIPQHMPVYEELIRLLDVPTRLIEIEAVIVDVNASNVADLGIDWGARAGNLAGGFGRPAVVPDLVTGTIVLGRDVNPTTVIPNAGNYLMARVRALEGKGNARVVSRPSVLTIDNLGALIDLSETFYVQLVGERVASVVPISVGTTLKVTPHIIENNGTYSVHLTVDIEDGSIQENNSPTTAQTIPRIRRSTIGTQAVMNEQESLLIGGFNTESDIRQTDQVPGLSGIPILGNLFRKRSARTEKRERLFLITPKILSLASDPAPPSYRAPINQ